MKSRFFPLNQTLVFGALISLSLLLAAQGKEPTAYDLVKEGNRYVSEEAKGRVVQIRSEKSIGTLVPNIWYVVYYDPDATAKATEVKFGGGKKISVKRPTRVLEPIIGKHRELPKEKLKVDSDKAVKIALAEPILKNVTVVATKLTLERWENDPVWKVELWANKLRDSSKTVGIGKVILSSDEGKVLENDLKTERVD